MKSIVIFYNDKNSKYKDEKIFNGKSSVELTKELFLNNDFSKNLQKIQESDIFTIKNCQNLLELFIQMNEITEKSKADFVIFSYNDLPFLNYKITKELIEYHLEYKAEYTFADGFAYGFSPEIIDCGTLRILLELSKTTENNFCQKELNRESLFELIKKDINSYEVETVLAEEDWRLLRFAFHCGKKDNYLQCKNLFEKLNLSIQEIQTGDVEAFTKVASQTIECLKTVPGFYNIQITDKINFESIYSPYTKSFAAENVKKSEKSLENFEEFSKLISKISEFSENAVINLSCWGESLLNPNLLKMIECILSYSGLSVFLETDGTLVTDDFCNELSKIVNNASKRTNGFEKLMISVSVDAFTSQTYQKIHPDCSCSSVSNDFEKSVEAVKKLCAVLPNSVYPQFVRMNQNEEELESFFRYWNEKSNPSNGNLIIQKYDDFAGLLPPCKPADLSPLERNVCWHLRRDFTILLNGDVPSCKTCLFGQINGNVFESSLEEIWQKNNQLIEEQIKNKYNQRCGKCDEYYTFNF